DLPGNAPFIPTPAARAFLSTIADNGVPVAVGLLLIVGGDLKRESFAVLERGTAVEAETGNAGHGEFDHQHVARLAGWKVGRPPVDRAHGAVGKGLGVKAGRRLGILVVPDADRVLFHDESLRFQTGSRPASRTRV